MGVNGLIRRLEPGAVRPGLLDILTALILLAILLWASWMQSSVYEDRSSAGSTLSSATSRQSRIY